MSSTARLDDVGLAEFAAGETRSVPVMICAPCVVRTSMRTGEEVEASSEGNGSLFFTITQVIVTASAGISKLAVPSSSAMNCTIGFELQEKS